MSCGSKVNFLIFFFFFAFLHFWITGVAKREKSVFLEEKNQDFSINFIKSGSRILGVTLKELLPETNFYVLATPIQRCQTQMYWKIELKTDFFLMATRFYIYCDTESSYSVLNTAHQDLKLWIWGSHII